MLRELLMQGSTAIKISAIATIAWLETIALLVLKIDGVLLTTVVAAIAGLAGYELRSLAIKKAEAKNDVD